MERLKRTWKRVPDKPRRIVTLIVGLLLVLVSPVVGTIPGPGGMIVFLLGIAVLASEFSWAERLRDYLLDSMKRAGAHARRHPRLSLLLSLIGIALIISFAYFFYTKIL